MALALFRTCVAAPAYSLRVHQSRRSTSPFGVIELADTRRAVRLRLAASARQKLCLHALSSFQRTGNTPTPPSGVVVVAPPIGRTGRIQGNLLRLLSDDPTVNPLFGSWLQGTDWGVHLRCCGSVCRNAVSGVPWYRRPINHCRAGARQANLLSLWAPCPDVNPARCESENGRASPFAPQTAALRRLRQGEHVPSRQ